MTAFNEYLKEYLGLLPSENWINELKMVTNETLQIYEQLTDEQGNFAYAKDKWSLKTLLEHLTDTEKIFHYRALRFARKDPTKLATFNENHYAACGTATKQTLGALIEEFRLNRQLSTIFFSKLTNEQLLQKGKVNGNEFSVELIGKLIVAHNIHHLNIIKNRYLPALKFNMK